MSLELFVEKKLSPEFKQYTAKLDKSPVFNAKFFFVFLFFTLLHGFLAYLIYMQMYTNEVTNAIYVLFALQFVSFVSTILSYALCIVAGVTNTTEFIS